ncbi:MAG: type I pullulanase [Acidobacteria bacterium]|nr:type I pullulanase [Acidobacteriota bacterium]
MRSFFPWLTLLLPLSLAATPTDTPAPDRKPVIFCARAGVDFGTVLQGRKVSHTFVVENHGDAPLNISGVVPNCNCTTADITRQIVEPGTSAFVRAVFDSSEFDGPVGKTIFVSSDDPERPTLNLDFKANVLRPYTTEPYPADFRRVSRNADFEMKLAFRGREGRQGAIRSVSVEKATCFEARFTPGTDAGPAVVVLRLKPGAPPHAVEATLVVTVDDPEFPVVRIPLRGQLLDDVTVFPAALDFGTLEPGAAFPRKVFALVANPAVTLRTVEFTPPFFSATVAKRASTLSAGPAGAAPEPEAVEVSVSVKPDAPPGPVKGSMALKTDSREQPVITLPLAGAVAAVAPPLDLDAVRRHGSDRYDGNDLGCTWTAAETGFKLWAPTARSVDVLLFPGPAAPGFTRHAMTRGPAGTWSLALPGDHEGKYYLYETVFARAGNAGGTVTFRVNDPCARGCSANSGRTLIYDPRKTDPPGWAKDRPVTLHSPTDAVICEMHLRDVSIHPSSGVPPAHRGKYLGAVQGGTRSPEGLATTLDHLAELGVTHVHLLPTFDYGTGDETEPAARYTWYNWGYDPVLYNAPEGSYASDPDGTARQREFKQMVQAFHRRGIGVVLDCVYNHTFRTGGDPFSVFDKVFPGYYYRFNPDGTYADGSQCRNEVASERPMVRKFIVDSIRHWLEEYHVDGFRFDLMGLMDRETMLELAREARRVNPGVLLYGEGWDMGSILKPDEKFKQANVGGTGVAAFNDGIRDNLKGDVFDAASKGFVQGAGPWLDMDRLKKHVLGAGTGRDKTDIPVRSPTETVNYVSCHDNLCLMDKLKASVPDAAPGTRVRMACLAHAVVLTSQGIPFLHLGDDFGRSKNGVENSFNNNDPAVNPVDWSLKAANREMFNFHRGLVALRRAHPAFRMSVASVVGRHVRFLEGLPENVLAYVLHGRANGDPWAEILVAFNGTAAPQTLAAPGRWEVVVDGLSAGTKTLSTAKDTVKIAPFSALVAHR